MLFKYSSKIKNKMFIFKKCILIKVTTELSIQFKNFWCDRRQPNDQKSFEGNRNRSKVAIDTI